MRLFQDGKDKIYKLINNKFSVSKFLNILLMYVSTARFKN